MKSKPGEFAGNEMLEDRNLAAGKVRIYLWAFCDKDYLKFERKFAGLGFSVDDGRGRKQSQSDFRSSIVFACLANSCEDKLHKSIEALAEDIPEEVPKLISLAAEDFASLLDISCNRMNGFISAEASMWEVIFRIGALRRLYLAEQIIENGALANYKFEKALRIVYTGDGEVRLSPAEFSIALHLFRNPGLPIAKIDLFRLYAKGSEINTRRIDMIISRIRKKLRLGPASGAVIISIPNVGYRLSLMRPHNSAVSR